MELTSLYRSLEGDSRRRESLRLQRYLAMLWESTLSNQVALDMNIAFFGAFKGFLLRTACQKGTLWSCDNKSHFDALRNHPLCMPRFLASIFRRCLTFVQCCPKNQKPRR